MATLDRAAELKARTKAFAIRIVRLYRLLPRSTDAQVLGKQLLRCGTSVGANYRAACRSRSKAEFISKMSVVLEEADESAFWLELLVETGRLLQTEHRPSSRKPTNWRPSLGHRSGPRKPINHLSI